MAQKNKLEPLSETLGISVSTPVKGRIPSGEYMFIARGSVHRLDTGERLAGDVAYGDTPEEALEGLRELLRLKVGSLPR